jgi:hypothetical protein
MVARSFTDGERSACRLRKPFLPTAKKPFARRIAPYIPVRQSHFSLQKRFANSSFVAKCGEENAVGFGKRAKDALSGATFMPLTPNTSTDYDV